ncbi:glycosyltransferase family 2 protein [Chiua virens]|nr:glycosyltransferase family 2 protein [Chiua virens]
MKTGRSDDDLEGSHVAKALFDLGAYVRVADIDPSSRFTELICNDTVVGNLCDTHFCERAVKGIDTVLHFAAVAGDNEAMDGGNDLTVYQTNATMTSNVLIASIRANVRVVLVASTAPLSLDHPGENAHFDALEGEDVWTGKSHEPQTHHTLEKLIAELLTQPSASMNMTVQIARFSNVFGPRDAWNNGREKAPVSLLRKALAMRLAENDSEKLQIWEEGRQHQCLLFISDCVDALLALLASGYNGVVNIGCDRIMTVGDLADIAVRSVGSQLGSDVVFQPETEENLPVNVRTRSSDNHLAQTVLCGWTPKVPVEEGMALTGKWLQSEMKKIVDGMEEDERYSTLQSMHFNKIIPRADGDRDITFAVLLPITSRGSNRSLSDLKTFADSLARTTWRDTCQFGDKRFVVKIYLAINRSDTFLSEKDGGDLNIAETVVSQNIRNIAIQTCIHSSDHVCTIWQQIAKQAWVDGFEYFAFMTNDVVLKDEGWLRNAHEEFARMADRTGTPHGFGCMAFTDTGYPGIPTFPIIHRTHLSIFGGNVTPETLINRGVGPFLHQLYRHWNCSIKLTARISGTSQPARGPQEDGNEWTFGPLDRAVVAAEEWISWRCPEVSRKLTLDVVIPSFRVQLQFLEPMLNLKASPTCDTMFIIIIDDPHSPARAELETRFASRSDIRIHVNDKNLGASASRNRGMKESAAEWIIFLDDDVTPQPDVLVETEKVIRANPDAVGFVGNAKFPPADLVFTTAAHLSGVTFFWDIAEKMPEETDMPWGVTANLIARRNDDGVEFDLQFPKTGGGEDIDFCRKKRDLWFPEKKKGFLPAPKVIVTHPWWNGGKRSYRRFYMWSKGDGGLIKLYPELCYIDHAPCSGELLLISCVLACIGVPFFLSTGNVFPLMLALHLVIATVVSHVLYDMYRHLYRDADRTKTINSTLSGPKWLLAIADSSLIRIFNECGRVVGLLERGEINCLGWRFDWFTGRLANGPRDEDRMNSRQKFALVIVILAILLRTISY